MHDTSVLELGEVYVDRRPMGGRLLLRILAVLLLSFAVLAALSPFGMTPLLRAIGLAQPAGTPVVRLPIEELRKMSGLNVDDKSQILVEGIAAQRQNAEIPLSRLPLEHARGFLLADNGQETYRSALRCLTQAVYYEAAREPMQGRRAVAQVVLNRMRHPAYPKSVCGVVYQGSERRTGCQFSFTCDGALLRSPMAHPWQEAEAVARDALAGRVEADVGTATHYHADYVLPKWAFELNKIVQFGRHIFYRFDGRWGSMAAFTGRYSGIERIPAINMLALRERLADEGSALSAGPFAENLTVTPHVTDRHAPADVGGRLDMTKQWRLEIPDPVQASSKYLQAIGAAPSSDNPTHRMAGVDQPGAELKQ